MRKFKILPIIFCMIYAISYSQNDDKMKIPKINPQFEKIDKNLFSDSIDSKMIIMDKNDTVNVNIRKTNSSIRYADKNGKMISYYSNGGLGSDGTISGYDYTTNPIIGVFKEFYPNGNIRVKGLYCWFGFKIGIWYYFNENGELSSIEDTDLGFYYNYEDIFKYCEKNNIILKKVEQGLRTEIIKDTREENKERWIIIYPNLKKEVYIILELSGNDGTLLNTKEQPLPH